MLQQDILNDVDGMPMAHTSDTLQSPTMNRGRPEDENKDVSNASHAPAYGAASNGSLEANSKPRIHHKLNSILPAVDPEAQAEIRTHRNDRSGKMSSRAVSAGALPKSTRRKPVLVLDDEPVTALPSHGAGALQLSKKACFPEHDCIKLGQFFKGKISFRNRWKHRCSKC